MRELVDCFIAWLQAEPSTNNAWRILDRLSDETLKRVKSPDPEQREFDAAQLAEACRPGETLDYENAKKWFTDARVPAFMDARKNSIEAFFRAKGYNQCLSLGKRPSGGRHKAAWFLKVYDLSPQDGAEQPTHDEFRAQTSSRIDYAVTEPGSIKLNSLGKLILGNGIFKTRSWRGAIWAILFVSFSLVLLSVLFLIFQMRTITRPIQTGDFILIGLLCSTCWLIWRFQIRPIVWLIEDRIGFASNMFIKFSENDAHFDLAKDGEHRYFRLVRYSAVCPICAGSIELRYGTGENYRRLFGCCTEVPTEHVFTFDRVSRVGTRYLP